MEIKGRVVVNLGVQKGTSKSGNQWSKATIVIETEGQYPKKIALDNMKNADSFGALSVGTEGIFHIEVESREFNGRWYTSVNCWKWETPQAPQPASQPTPQPAPQGWQSVYPQPQQYAPQPTSPAPATDNDPLPF